MSHSQLINHLWKLRHLGHLGLLISPVLVLLSPMSDYDGCNTPGRGWGGFFWYPPTERSEVRDNSRTVPGIRKVPASCPRTLHSCSTDAFWRLDCPSKDPATRLACTMSQLWPLQRGHRQYMFTLTYCITLPDGVAWGCDAHRSLFIKL